VSGTEDPNRVTNIEVVTAGNNTINITWDTMINIDGYYIYRSYGSNNLYELIKDEGDISVHEYFDNDVEDISNVWYIMSAYIVVDSAKLEGYRSEPTTWTQ
jgi:fibronectin type 3 domain-containing protein